MEGLIVAPHLLSGEVVEINYVRRYEGAKRDVFSARPYHLLDTNSTMSDAHCTRDEESSVSEERSVSDAFHDRGAPSFFFWTLLT